MVRTIPVISLVVFAVGCGGGLHGSPPPPIDHVGSVEVRAWPKANTHELLQRTADKPAHVILTVASPREPAIAWVTTDGSDLRAVYCVSPEDVEGAQARIASQRKAPIEGFILLGVKPGLDTRLCHPGARLHTEDAAPPPPPPPPPPTTLPPPTKGDGTITATPCTSQDAACNYVILSPHPPGPAGTPPPPDEAILQRFDLQLQRLRIFTPRVLRPGGTINAPR